MEFKELTISVTDRIGRITLNRAHKANALNAPLWQEIRRAFRWAHETQEVRVVLLEANGKHFCSGIDVGLLAEIMGQIQPKPEGKRQESLHGIIRDLQECLSAIEDCAKPVIAVIQGSCLGGGVDLIAACDIRIAETNARFAVKEVDLGIVADVGTLQRLPHLVSQGTLREWAFTGRTFSASEAQQAGLINQVVAESDLAKHATEMAQTIARKSPLTVRGIKQVLNVCRDLSVNDGLRYVAAWNASMLLSQETQIASMALMTKRTPEFLD